MIYEWREDSVCLSSSFLDKTIRGHVQMTSVLRGGGRVSQFLTIRGGGCVISILKILTGGGGGSKIPKIRLTSFVHGPLP